LDQVIDALIGTAGQGVALAVTAVNDATQYALTVQNDEVGNSRALNVIKSDGTLLVRADASGVSLGAPLNLAAGSVQTAALADQGVTNAKLGPDVARANLLTNGSFDVWQRGAGPFSASTAYAADRWSLTIAGTDTLSVTRNTANVDTGSVACAACTFTLGTGAGGTGLMQNLPIGDATWLAGTTVSASVRVRTSTANAVRIGLNNFFGSASHVTNSAFHPGDGAYHTLTVTVTLDPTATACQLYVFFAASCTAYLDNAMLVVGSVAANYVPMHPADDRARCIRYYEIVGEGSTGSMMISGIASAGGQTLRASFRHQSTKAVTPTVTKAGTWSVGGAGQPSVVFPSVDGFHMQITSGGAGDQFAYNGGAGSYVTSEANP
jgi:hypothetical protein